jgi:hypothetical protein
LSPRSSRMWSSYRDFRPKVEWRAKPSLNDLERGRALLSPLTPGRLPSACAANPWSPFTQVGRALLAASPSLSAQATPPRLGFLLPHPDYPSASHRDYPPPSALAISLGLAMAEIGLNIQHDAGHGGYSRRQGVKPHHGTRPRCTAVRQFPPITTQVPSVRTNSLPSRSTN